MEKKVANNKLFFYLFSIFPLIDLLNGYLLSINNKLPIGTGYRLVILIYGVLIVFKNKIIAHKDLSILLFINFVVFSTLTLVQAMFFNRSLSQIMSDFTGLSKYFLWLVTALIFSEYLSSEGKLEKLTVKINLFFCLGMIIPYLLGIGNFTYANSSAGYKSFFFATNDLTYAFIILSSILSFYIIDQFNQSKSLYFVFLIFLYSLNLVCMLIIGTKSGIVYGGVNLIIVFFYLIFVKANVSYTFKFYLIQVLIILAVFFLVIGKNIVESMLDGIFDRIAYFYKVYEGNWIKILSSSRSIYLEDAWHNFLFYPKNYLILLFGFGAANRWTLFGRQGGNIEMDFFDTAFSYGFVGCVVLVVSLAYIVKKYKSELGNKRYLYLFFVSLIYAFFTGHVFYSAMSAMIFGTVIGGMFIKRNKEVV
ncbi:O-antigen ligase family protein [Enterococcus faecalis]|uniref:O-antigen ligase family protein n=1 Tax=Enterococcus faecalis TaxID=1351 RepID=UPI002DBB72CD|nr:O-antigen ligase family protein [Enterococcus faecalis]MEB7428086.1 O-antigen ligase family protein [Enterococcus faecalis]